MANFNLLVVGSNGKPTQKASNAQTMDFASIRLGANNETISEVSSGILSLNGAALRTSTAPSNDDDLTRKRYVDDQIAAAMPYGISWKNMAKIATKGLGNITLSNTQTLDGVALTAGMRVLVNDQTDAKENGVYDVVSGGAWTRSTDLDTGAELFHSGIFVEQGTLNQDTGWIVANDTSPTIGVDNILYTKFNSNIYTASSGILLTGSNFTLKTDYSESSSFGTIEVTTAPAYGSIGNASASVRFEVLKAPAAAFSAYDAVYIDSSTGKVQRAAKNTASLEDLEVGIALSAAVGADDPATVPVTLRRGAIIDGFSGLTPGALYYINTAGAVALYSAITWATNDVVYSIGRAHSATKITFNPQFHFIY